MNCHYMQYRNSRRRSNSNFTKGGRMKKRIWAFAIPAVILLAVFLVPSLLTSQSAVMDKPSKEDVAHKMRTIQIPFVANNGQVDKQVKFYAKTFGGTVFVTKDGEIVYSLPGNSSESGVESLESDGRRQRAEEIRQMSGNRCKKSDSNPKSAIQNLKSGVAIKETLVGGRVQEITGNEKAVTKVSYFKGNDPSQWKTNISTYGVVSLGEVYDGIELKLKAYGNNVNTRFCVKPGADPEQIQIKLSGAKDLRVNDEGQLEAETELGPVKFTKPVAYQEIDGKRVEVAVEYRIQESGDGSQKSELNPKSRNSDSKNLKSAIQNLSSTEIGEPKLEYGFKVASY